MSIREEIQSLNELQLIDKILIPLFRALGSIKVEKFHGINENGIDIYFSYPDIFGINKHCAVLVKKGDIRKSGKHDIRKIHTQINEALVRKFVNPLGNVGEVNIQEFWFVCSGIFNNPAKNYLNEMCNEKHMPFVRIIDIDILENKIIEVIRNYNKKNGLNKDSEQYIFTKNNFVNLCDKYRKNDEYNYLDTSSDEGQRIKA